MDIIFIRSVLAIFLSVFIVVAPVSANDREKNGRNKHHDKNRFDGYSHHDDKSGQYDKNKKRKEWKGRHKGCNIKGKHYHDDHNAPLNCQDAVSAPSKLWPANHKFKKINIDGLSTSDGSAPSITYQCVFQDEPLNAEGDGNTDVDAKINSGDLFLRKERAGNGNGRVYHVDFLATDNSNGDSCEGTVVVEVPHNKKGMAKDDGRLYTSLAIGSNCGDSENQVPMITSNPVIDTTATLDYTYSVIATDADNDVLGYELVESPEGMTIDSDGIISWTPNDLQVGNHAVSIAVDDGNGGQATQDYIVSVTARPNSAPVISSTPVLDATEAQAYSYSVQAADPDGDAISFSLSLAPTGMEINESGLIQWAPMVGQAGDHSVSLLVTDIYGAIAQQDFVITVAPKPNDAPVITSTPVIEVAEGDNYLYVITVMDPNNDPVTLSLIQAPTGLVLNQNTLSWNPDFNQAGEYPISILATDSNGASASQSYTLTVLDTNQLPVITSTPLLIANEGEFYQYPVVASDADGDALQYSLELAPEGLLISDSGLIEWLPGYELAGVHEVQVKVDDGKQGTATQHFSLDVINTNRDPQITSQPIITATENIQYLYQVTTNDDDGDVIQFNLANAPAGMIIANDGLISWLPDYNTAGDHTVDVEITDGIATVTQTFVITVINSNQPPMSDDLSVTTDEDNAVVITLTASDSDGDALTYAIETDPQHGTVALNANEATYTPAANFNGQDTFTFTSNDGTTNSNSATVTIDIAPINDLPVFNSLPTTTATENQSYASFVSAIDIDGDVLTYSLNAGPLGLAINSVTGEINWSPNFEQSGSHPVTLSVSDGTATQSLNFEIVVTNVNRAPTISSAPVVTANENEIYSYQVIAQDADNDVLAYSLNQSPAGMTINSTTGSIQWMTNYSSSGTYQTSIVVTDSYGASAQQNFNITVNDINRNPQIQNAPPSEIELGNSFVHTAIAIDPDDDVITYQLIVGPSGMSLSLMSGDFYWQPSYVDVGPQLITYAAYDSKGGADTKTFILNVLGQISNSPPKITSIPNLILSEGQDYSYTVTATDADEDVLSYYLDNQPTGMAIDQQSGLISWQPEIPKQIGKHVISVRVEDGHNGVARQNFLLELKPDSSNQAPIFDSQIVAFAEVDTLYSYAAHAVDPDNDPLSYSLLVSPNELSINTSSGLISGVFVASGDYQVVVEVTDGRHIVNQAYSINVSEKTLNVAPVFDSVPVTIVNENQLYNYYAHGFDLNNDVLKYSASSIPNNLTVNSLSGTVVGQFDSSVAQSLEVFNPSCGVPPVELGKFEPVVKWHNPLKTLSIPVVGPMEDSNGDGLFNENDNPVIVINTYSGFVDVAQGRLVGLDGKTGAQLWVAPTLGPKASSNIAIADIQGDKAPEIIYYRLDGYVEAADNHGNIIWTNTDVRVGASHNLDYNYGAINVADIDGDGKPEIIALNWVLSADGQLLWKNDIQPYHWATAYAADVDLDGVSEVVMGGRIFSNDGTLLYEPLNPSAATVIGNFDDDDAPEIVGVFQGYMTLAELDGTVIWGPIATGGRGAPNIADFDGDGKPEIGVAGTVTYKVIDTDGSELWAVRISDGSNVTGSTVFDFDGDGDAEVVYADQSRLRVYDGKTGVVQYSLFNDSSTASEYPVVADIDADGHAEILVTSDGSSSLGIRAIEEADDKWVATRKIWNQYNYHVDNINDDLSVPSSPPHSWLKHNTFRLNAFPNGNSLALADLRVGDISYDDSSQTLTAIISNIGVASVQESVDVEFLFGDNIDNATPIASVPIQNILVGSSQSASIQIATELPYGNIFARINYSKSLAECQYENNYSQAAVIKLSVEDVEGLSDKQVYLLNVHNVNEAPIFVSGNNQFDVVTGTRLEISLAAADKDRGDVLTYSVEGAPSGLSINIETGSVSWLPQLQEAGIHVFNVIATDLSGLATSREISINVVENFPPEIISTPIDKISLSGSVGVEIPIDVNNWSSVAVSNVGLNGGTSNPDAVWNFVDATTVIQRGNPVPSVLVSDFDFSNSQINGSLRVDATSDDDVVGFVFGFQNPYKFYKFYWKKSAQNNLPRGWYLAVYDLASNGSEGWPTFYTGTPEFNGKLLYQNESYGWDRNVTYSYELSFVAGNISIILRNGDVILDSINVKDDTFTTGKFGFYNASQDQTRYKALSATSLSGDAAYFYDVDAIDPEGAELTYSLYSYPQGMKINSLTGEITWQASIADVGGHAVSVRVEDEYGATDNQFFTLAVTNDRPVIVSQPVTAGYVDIAYGYDVNAVDSLPGSVLTYSLQNPLQGMSINSATGLISWQPSLADIGTYQVTVVVQNDLGLTDTQTYSLEVTELPLNQSPIFSSTPPIAVNVNNQFSYVPVATDPDGDTVSISLVKAPAGLNMFDGRTINWIPNSSQIGLHEIIIEVTDGKFGVAQQVFVVEVTDTNINQAPAITSSPVFNAKVGAGYVYQVEASDNDGDSLLFELSQYPTGMNINSVTGIISWIPSESDSGEKLIEINVTDGFGGSARQTFSLNVGINGAPVITSTPQLFGQVGLPYSYDVQAIDPEGDALTYSLLNSSAGISINQQTGLISWVPQSIDEGINSFTVIVTDTSNLSVRQSFNVEIVSSSASNLPPILNKNIANVAFVGKLYQNTIDVTDPDGDTILFSLISGPEGLTLSDNGAISWTPTNIQIGQHLVQLEISDGEYVINYDFYITVNADQLPLDVSVIASPMSVQAGDPVIITLTTQGGDNLSTELLINGELVSINNGIAEITPQMSGRYDVIGKVTDNDTAEVVTKSTYFSVAHSNDVTPPNIEITLPFDGAVITSLTEVVGTINDANLANYRLALQRKGSTDAQIIAEGSNEKTNEVITELDPSIQLNGQYDLILEAVDTNGQLVSTSISVVLDGDLKVGNFSFTVMDVEIPLSGIPIQVSRTYDSRRKHEKLDFGFGWTVDYQNVRVEESRVLGKFWQENQYPSGPFGIIPIKCIEPQGAPTVSVTLPNGDVESFQVKASGGCTELYSPTTFDLKFDPIGDTQSTLTSEEGNGITLINNQLVYIDAPSIPIDPDLYVLTTKSGYIYRLNQNFGVVSIETPNGQTLTYTDNGIFHSDGKNVLFNRDEEGKITSITDPSGNVFKYTYNSINDLVAATDQVEATTSYKYNRNHGLLDIIDPLGRTLIKNIYDDSGKLIAQEDNEGNRTEFNHDLAGRQSIVTDRNNNITIFYYNERGDVLSQVDALNNITTFEYDERGNQLSKIDALGNITLSTFNTNNDQLTQTDALGNTTTFEYNARGQETQITDAAGNVFTNVYDSVGNLLSITSPDGSIAGNIINAKGLVSKTTDMLGNETNYTYDSEGNKLTETDSTGAVTSFTYDANNNVLTETRSRTLADNSVVNETTTYEYDAKNRVTATINSLGQRTETEYGLAGQVIAELDALGRRTEMDYDVYGRLLETRYPDGTREQKTYDAEGNLLSETNRNNQTTTYEYDALNRQVFVIDANGQRSETVYNEIGQVVAVIDARGNRTEYEYDAIGRRTLTRDALFNEHTFEYDVNGNLTAEVDALNHRKEYIYNELDQRIKTTFDDGSSMSETYDALGRRSSQTDQDNKTTAYEYDSLGRLIKVIDHDLNETAYTYDEAGNKLTQTDAEGRTTQWTYDALGRVTSRRLPLGQTETFTYDSLGQLIAQSDFNGNITIHTYTINNQISRTDFSDGSYEQFAYDNNGNRVSAIQVDASGFSRTTLFVFDNLNRLSSETKPNGTVLAYTYDEVGNKKQLTVTLPDTTQQITTYTYDALNRLETVTDTNGTTSYGYDAVGNRASVSYPNNTSQVYTYDTLNRLTQLNTYNANGTLVQSFDYTLHATGRRLQIDELSGRSTQYTYDNLYRLTSETITDATNDNHTASYEYDRVGNRLYETVNGVQTAYSYDNNDRLLQSGGTVFTYDNQGNTLTQTLDGAVTSYSYNRQHELISQTQAGITTSFAYNADGIRNAKADSTTTTNFLIDNNLSYAQVIREDNGSQIISYTYGDDLINQIHNGAISYFHYDGLGSTRALSNASGVLTDSYDYEAFGEVLNQTGSTDNNYLFAGEQFDSALDQYYLRARYYSQGTGRFTQQDTYLGNNSDPVTLHKYLYANADPGNVIDPSGKFGLVSFSVSYNIRSIMTTASTARVFGTAVSLNAGAIATGAVFPLAFEFYRSGVRYRSIGYYYISNGQYELGRWWLELSAAHFKAFSGFMNAVVASVDIVKATNSLSKGMLEIIRNPKILIPLNMKNLLRINKLKDSHDSIMKNIDKMRGVPPSPNNRTWVENLFKAVDKQALKFLDAILE